MRTLAVTLIAVLVAACGSTGPEDSYLNMSVDGASWSASGPTMFVAGVLSVSGSDPTVGGDLDLFFENAGTGTYDVEDPGLTTMTYTVGTDVWQASYAVGGTGSIVVTKVTSIRVGGTFSGQLLAQSGQTPDTLTITNGSFEIFY